MTRRSTGLDNSSAVVGISTANVSAHPATSARAPSCSGSHWVGSWSAAPSGAANEGFAEQTLRLVVHPQLRGDTVRLRLTNRLADQAVTFGEVHVGLHVSHGNVKAGTNRAVTFGGDIATTVPVGSNVVSDPVALTFEVGDDLAISLYMRGATGPATEHDMAVQKSFVTPRGSGNHAADEDSGAFTDTTTSWFFVEGVDVVAPRSVGAVVAFGDSITDGFVWRDLASVDSGDPDALGVNGRYPDHLARRLHDQSGPSRVSVLNAGISGNEVNDGTPIFGPSGRSRLAPDVLAQPGVTDVIVMEGTNDLADAPLVRGKDVIDGLDDIVWQLQASGLNVILGTIPPAEGAAPWVGHGSAAATAERNLVNDWIRTRPRGVGVVDFHEVLRDPGNPNRLKPEYDSGDGLHPSLDGYRAMADAVDLSQLAGTGCGPIRTASVTEVAG